MLDKDRVRHLEEEVERLRRLLSERAGSLEDALKRRGYILWKKESDPDLIMPERDLKGFYEKMKRYSFRLFLRDVLKHQEGFVPEHLVRYSTLPVVEGYINFLLKSGIVESLPAGLYALRRRHIKSFGPTLEWFIAELLRREYLADVIWGARFRNVKSGGDYDLLGLIEGRLVYAEIKSSPPKQIYDREIKAYLERSLELSPALSLFIIDTELRMKDKIVYLFEQVLPGTPLGGMAVERFKDELFHIGGRIFIINSKDGLESNIREVIGWYLKRSSSCPAA